MQGGENDTSVMALPQTCNPSLIRRGTLDTFGHILTKGHSAVYLTSTPQKEYIYQKQRGVWEMATAERSPRRPDSILDGILRQKRALRKTLGAERTVDFGRHCDAKHQCWLSLVCNLTTSGIN